MGNFVLGTAIGYDKATLMPFVHSLRKHYKENIVFFVNCMDEELREFFHEYTIVPYYVDPSLTSHVSICNYRHNIYRDFLTTISPSVVDRILITDVRDVIFQDDPFKHQTTVSLEFFLENRTIGSDYCNGEWWIGNTYGLNVLNDIRNNIISCAGTTIGTYDGMMHYLSSLIQEIYRMESILGKHNNPPIVDQACHNYLIYNNKFVDSIRFYTKSGPVATLSFNVGEYDIKFDNEDNMLNDDGSIVAIVHQWDRSVHKDRFYKKAIAEV